MPEMNFRSVIPVIVEGCHIFKNMAEDVGIHVYVYWNFCLQAPQGLQGCKNRPASFSDQML